MSGKTKNSILKNRWVQLTISLCAVVLFYLFIANINLLLEGFSSFAGFISPVVIGLVLAYIMNPLSNLFEDYVFRKVKKPTTRHSLAVVTTIAAVLLILTVLLSVLIPQLFRSAAYLVGHINIYTDQLQGFVSRIAGKSADRHLQIESITNSLNSFLDNITSSITGNYDNLVTTSVTFGKRVVNYVIAFILAVYFLLDKEKLVNGCKSLMQAALKGSSYDRSMDFLSRCHTILIRYIAFDIIDGLMVGVVNYIFMKIAGMPYAGLVSIVVGVTNLAPTFGPIVGCAIGAFILVLINPFQALLFIIFTVLLQVFDGYIFKPRLFGATLGVSPLLIILFIVLGGRLFGVAGILLAIPVAAIADFVYREFIITRLEDRRKQLQDEDDDRDVKTVMQTIREGFSEMTDDVEDPGTDRETRDRSVTGIMEDLK